MSFCGFLIACGGSTPTDISAPDETVETTPTVGTGNGSLTVVFPDYLAKVQFGFPFGIMLLETLTQPRGFTHPEFPIADWEWFWFGEDSRAALKLIQPGWPPPVVAEEADSVVISFSRNVSLGTTDFQLGVDYVFHRSATIDVVYRVGNKSDGVVRKPFVMVGFPGFSSPESVNQIANGIEIRSPVSPFLNFRQEILDTGREEATLLWYDWNADTPETLTSVITLFAFGGVYELEASYTPDEDISALSSGHVLKPAYLTSHLYVLLQDIPAKTERRLKVHYKLHDSTRGPD